MLDETREAIWDVFLLNMSINVCMYIITCRRLSVMGDHESMMNFLRMGIPMGINPPSRDGDGKESIPVTFCGDGDGEFLPPRGWRWGVVPRWGIPRCHL